MTRSASVTAKVEETFSYGKAEQPLRPPDIVSNQAFLVRWDCLWREETLADAVAVHLRFVGVRLGLVRQ